MPLGFGKSFKEVHVIQQTELDGLSSVQSQGDLQHIQQSSGMTHSPVPGFTVLPLIKLVPLSVTAKHEVSRSKARQSTRHEALYIPLSISFSLSLSLLKQFLYLSVPVLGLVGEGSEGQDLASFRARAPQRPFQRPQIQQNLKAFVSKLTGTESGYARLPMLPEPPATQHSKSSAAGQDQEVHFFAAQPAALAMLWGKRDIAKHFCSAKEGPL